MYNTIEYTRGPIQFDIPDTTTPCMTYTAGHWAPTKIPLILVYFFFKDL